MQSILRRSPLAALLAACAASLACSEAAAQTYPHAPIAPHAVQNSHPSLCITAALPHSAQRLPGSAR